MHQSNHQETSIGLLAKLDKAPDYGSGDCRFESCVARLNFFLLGRQTSSEISPFTGFCCCCTLPSCSRGQTPGVR
ncbi:hypothetical protein PAPYR_9375 [Paratrimastix pyriformis]|uniref:Uncharacterized protein n=1 Tax=Paratrimastix pyriformis TaxID=342808 RepID=A0ABQ8U8I6_9EUKA|nr:hypothetical protein PAPYR_9375 [Paratrimastix pyriformis]